MPTYEYRCLKCKKKFERLQSMKDPQVKKCPKCGGKPERLISGGTGLIFKGTGFYITDYKKKSDGARFPDRQGERKAQEASQKKETKPAESKKESSPDKKTGK